MPQGIGHAFHACPDHLRPGHTEIQSEEYAAGVRIPDRAPLPRHVRQEGHAAASRLRGFRQRAHLREAQLRAHRFPQPLQCAASAGRSALQQPPSRHHVEAEDQPRIRRVLIDADAHAAGLSALLLGLSRGYYAGSQRAAGRVQSACRHRNAFPQSHLLCRFPGQPSHDLVAGCDLRQQFPRNAQRFAHILVPAALPHIEAGQAVSLGQILCDLAGHPVDDIAVRLQDLLCLLIHLRPVLPVPEDLRPGISRLGRIPAQVKQFFRRQPVCRLPADFLAPGIRPDRRRAQHVPIPVQRDGRPALSVCADSGDFRRIDAVIGDHFTHCPAYAVPPPGRILFRPALPGITDGILASALRDDLSFRIKQRRLTGGGSDIHAKQQGSHLRTLLVFVLLRLFRCFPVAGSAPAPGSARPCGLPPGTFSDRRLQAVPRWPFSHPP